MSHIYAFDPKVKPARRLVAGEWCRVLPILYTDNPRCGYCSNPKRPTWRCKRPPTVMAQRKDQWAMILCGPCYEVLRRVRP